jgi:transposase
MTQKSIRPTRPAMIVHSVSRSEEKWVIEAESRSLPRCPSCGAVSGRQHSWYQRSLRDLPIQGTPVAIRLRVRKWRCAAPACARSIFAEQLPGLASPYAHQSDAIADILAARACASTPLISVADCLSQARVDRRGRLLAQQHDGEQSGQRAHEQATVVRFHDPAPYWHTGDMCQYVGRAP